MAASHRACDFISGQGEASVGRKSREKRERRRHPAHAAEKRGRAVPPRPADIERQVRRRGSRGLKEVLLARHNLRWEAGSAHHEVLAEIGLPLHSTVFYLDVVLDQLGVALGDAPKGPYGSWAEQVQWGLDSVATGTRFVLAGNGTGAAAIARSQLERWTANRASTFGIEPHGDEPTERFYARVWRERGGSGLPPAGVLWRVLSEALHARGASKGNVRWETGALMQDGPAPDGQSVLRAAAGAQRLALIQLKGCIATMVDSVPAHRGEFNPARAAPEYDDLAIVVREASPSLWPLLHRDLDAIEMLLRTPATMYQREVRRFHRPGADHQEPLLGFPELGVHSYIERRWRSCLGALAARQAEQKVLGADYDPESLEGREYAYVLVWELAGLIGTWSDSHYGHAISTSAQALRAAFWLWLEDDERAMMVARTCLESLAQARARRTKASRSERVDALGAAATPSRWLEAAGWRRLAVLNRSLGEYSHADPARIRWRSAHRALAQLHPREGASPSTSLQTARGDTLNRCAILLLAEALEYLKDASPLLANAMDDLVGEDATSDTEAWLNHVWNRRELDFGPPEMRSLPARLDWS